MITITVAEDGRVTRIGYQDKVLPKGAIAVDAIPAESETDETQVAVLYYTNGALEWRIEAAPPMPEPEPEEPHKPTAEEITEMRKAAYVQRVDPITCEIERLKEMDGTPEEIEDARYRRAEEVSAIKAEYPYPEKE